MRTQSFQTSNGEVITLAQDDTAHCQFYFGNDGEEVMHGETGPTTGYVGSFSCDRGALAFSREYSREGATSWIWNHTPVQEIQSVAIDHHRFLSNKQSNQAALHEGCVICGLLCRLHGGMMHPYQSRTAIVS